MPLLAGVLLVASWIGIYLLAHHAAAANPIFHEVTFRNGTIWAARFAPDGQTIVYGAAWEGQPQEIFSTPSTAPTHEPSAVARTSPRHLFERRDGDLPASHNHRCLRAGRNSGSRSVGGRRAPRGLDQVFWADWAPDAQSLAVIRPSSRPIAPGISDWQCHLRTAGLGQPCALLAQRKFSGDRRPCRGGDDGRVVIIDTHGNAKASSSFYSSVEGLAWAPNGKEVWFSAVPGGSERSIYAVDFSGKERLIYRAPGGLR